MRRRREGGRDERCTHCSLFSRGRPSLSLSLLLLLLLLLLFLSALAVPLAAEAMRAVPMSSRSVFALLLLLRRPSASRARAQDVLNAV